MLIEWSCAASKNTYNIIKLNGIVERERRRTAKLTNLEQHLNNASSFVVFFLYTTTDEYDDDDDDASS